MADRRVTEYYDSYVGRQSTVGINRRHHTILRLAKQNGLHAGMKVLEIGCGVGTFTSLLHPQLTNGSLLSVDISPESIKEAQKRLGPSKNLSLLVADPVTEPIPGRYDLIILPDVLEHIPADRHAALFQRLKELLLSDGTILIHSPDAFYSEWLRRTQPELLQIVDLALHLPELIGKIDSAGLILHHFQRHSIWMDKPEYMALSLRHKPSGEKGYNETIPTRSLFKKLFGWIRK
jgi:cyclopropane fatty-acyl-phospholipid synthase-like methyltransferase